MRGGAARGGGALLQFLPGRAHRGNLLGGESLERLGDEVWMGCHHLLPPRGLHHVRHVPVVDELYRLQEGQDEELNHLTSKLT